MSKGPGADDGWIKRAYFRLKPRLEASFFKHLGGLHPEEPQGTQENVLCDLSQLGLKKDGL
jgi:hypothetical protein